MKLKDITLIGILSSILFIVDQALTFVPFLQMTMLLIILFSRKLGMIKSSIIILIFTLLDYLIAGFNLLFFIFSLGAWLIVPLLSNFIFKNTKSIILLSLQGVLFSFLYSWIHIVPSCLILGSDLKEYILVDISFEIIFALSSLLSILLLYKPLEKVIDRFI